MKIEIANLKDAYDPKTAAANFVAGMRPATVQFTAIDKNGAKITPPVCRTFSEAWSALSGLSGVNVKSFYVSGIRA